MATSSKKPRFSPCKEVLYHFLEHEKYQQLKRALETFCSPKVGGIVALTIRECNAAYGRYRNKGKLFSEADVDVKTNIQNIYCLGTLFRSGVVMLSSYLENPEIAIKNMDGHMEIILSKLLVFLMDIDNHVHLMTLRKAEKIPECDLAVRLAEHLLTKLTASSTYTLDKHYNNHLAFRRCNCGCNIDVSRHYGDTSIGNSRVWHGKLDILIDNIPVLVIGEGETDSPKDGKTFPEIKLDTITEDFHVTSELLAQTIVFSFAQKQKHKEYSNCLIPTLGISKDKYIFYFYDSEHDILLKSAAFDIFVHGKVNTFCILAIWFVLNYRYLCSGLTDRMIEEVQKANFFELVDGQLPVYQNELSVGGVPLIDFVEDTFKPWLEFGSTFVEMDPVDDSEHH